MCDLFVLLISFDIVWYISSVPDVFLNGINYIWCYLTLFLNYQPTNKTLITRKYQKRELQWKHDSSPYIIAHVQIYVQSSQ